MYFQRFYLDCLAHASYLVADEETKVAAVIDPQRDIEIYLRDAADHGFEIKHVILTHFHADFVAGHIELRDRVGATIYLGRGAKAEYAFSPLGEGDAIEFGEVRLSTLETPGHTPEGISLLVFDLAKNATEPYAVLTGDTLFVGDVGRPDLLASIGVSADELADMLYDSLHHKLLKLPDATRIYPAHGAGSMCGKQLSSEPFSTIGEQRRYNYALQPMERAEFKRMIMADQPEAPDYFVHDAILNRQDRPSLDESMRDSLRPLNLDAVLELQQQGVQVVDVRAAADFAAAHLRKAINIGLDGKYATWSGTILGKDRPIVVIADEGRQKEAIMRLGRIGFDQVQGYLAGGPAALEPRPELVDSVDRITAVALSERLVDVPAPLVLDIRAETEWQQGHIDGSVNIPLNHLVDRLDKVPRDKPLVVHCQGGYRSSIAASLLKQNGFERVSDLVGGFKAWSVSQLPFVEGAAATV